VALVERFARPRIMLIGDVMVDEYIYGNAERLSPEAPVPVVIEKYRERGAGGAGNVAADLAVLGAEVLCVAIRGADFSGELLVSLLQKSGANTDGVLAFADRPTTCKTRFVGLAQHRHPQQMLRLDHEETRPLRPEQEAKLIAYIRAQMPACDAVCLEDYNKGLLHPDFCRKVIALAREMNKPILVDPAAIKDYSKYRGVTTITPNRTEAELGTGMKLADTSDAAPELARVLTERLELEACVLTLDRHGIYLLEKGKSGVVHSSKPRNVYDVTGAGDMVLAMLTMARASGGSWSEAADLANLAGGLEVERFGCVPIRKNEILTELLSMETQGQGKSLTLGQLAPELERRRRLGMKIVFTNGVFDILHAGHVSYLNFARAQGDVLVVGVNSDASTRRLKGPDRPVNGLGDRMAVVSGLAAVDFVVPFDEDTPAQLIAAVGPDVLVKGADHAGTQMVGSKFVEAAGGRVVLAPFMAGKSTSGVIERIKE
jgi:D-beta-D-heptose 7-phosphate kinase/D-beta-D-heptose 1-phosphate adenosyltransferase